MYLLSKREISASSLSKSVCVILGVGLYGAIGVIVTHGGGFFSKAGVGVKTGGVVGCADGGGVAGCADGCGDIVGCDDGGGVNGCADDGVAGCDGGGVDCSGVVNGTEIGFIVSPELQPVIIINIKLINSFFMPVSPFRKIQK